MPQAHIRLARTPDVDKVLTFLRSKYRLLSEAEILKLLLSEKYEDEMKESVEKELQLTHQFTTNVLDLETYPNVQEAKAQARIPRKHINLLSMAGAFKGAPDLSRNKKKSRTAKVP